jgi:hypothetical protein
MVLPCIYVSDMNPPYGAAWSITMTAQLAKNGGQTSGTVSVVQDTTPEISCASGTATTGALTLTPLLQSNDTDGDGCPDYKELGSNQLQGGLRDPFNPWDYMDASNNGTVGINDIVLVVGQFFKDDNDGSPGLPPYAAGYNPDTDRTPIIGGNPWNLGPPNGQQRINDILLQARQFLHNCA